MRWALFLLVLSGCGESTAPDPTADGGLPDAPAAALELSPFSRQGAPFEPLQNGSTLPFFSGFQGFRLFDLQVRAPASLAAPSTVRFAVSATLVGFAPVSQSGDLTFSLPPSNGTRDSDRYVMYLNDFTEVQLEGASCRVTAKLGSEPAAAAADVTIRLFHSSCVDYGAGVVCPDGG